MEKINRIVLIDDDEPTNIFHEIIVQESGLVEEYDIYSSAIAALQELTKCEKKIDLIFLDINMPKMNGWDFLDQYRKLDLECQSKCVIMLSTSLSTFDQKRAEDNPLVTHFIQKPLSEEKLRSVIQVINEDFTPVT